MKNTVNSVLLIFMIVSIISILILSAFSSIINGKNCDQFVIDSYEYISGIDIPKQTTAKCFYHEKVGIRLGIYTID